MDKTSEELKKQYREHWEKWLLYKPMLWRLCMFLAKGVTADAEDLLTQSSVKCCISYGKNIANYKSWACKIIKHEWIDLYRKRGTEKQLRTNLFVWLSQQHVGDLVYQNRLLEEIVSYTKKKCYELFSLHFLEGKRSREIAEIMNLDSSVIRKRIIRLKKEINTHLG